jgi:outer membrane protein OmpA-like peptidoglycan-associated protein
VASGLAAVVVSTPFEDFTVEVRRGGPRPEGEQLELALWAANQFRFGLDMGEPGVVGAARELVRLLDGDGFSDRDAFSSFATVFGGIAARLEEELLAGRLVVEPQRFESLTERRDLFDPELPPLPPPRPESTHTFEVRFVDEIGKAISGIDAEFTADGAQTRPTNSAGIALLDGVQSPTANVAILDPEALAKVLDPRWAAFRPGKPPKESNTREVVFHDTELGPFDLKAELPNTIVIKPPLGKLFVELWDKTGRVRHANQTYQITGPQSFEGTTDDDGRLLHGDVFPGDYQLSLGLEFFEESDPDRALDIVESPLVVLDPSGSAPQVRMLGAVPRSVLARLHMFFNTNKTFLLPTALPSVRKLRKLYLDNVPCKLLVVGHADTKAGAAHNDQLSLARAQATIAYLKDDVEGWFKFYGQGVDVKQRWGNVEDRLMIVSMPDFVDKPRGEDEVRWYQSTRRLSVDGVAGTDTRHALIEEYMSLDGASLRDFVGEIEAVAHGCGEHFPLDESGEELDAAPQDEKRDPIDRRVELFFFDPEFGITPPPPGPNSKAGGTEYPLWRKRVAEIVDLREDDLAGPRVIFVELADAHFRTDSAVVLAEGETPDDAEKHESLSSIGFIAEALRFNQERGNLKLLVAGHTDSAGSEKHNQKLSEERAKVGLALLTGDRETFKKTCNERHRVADVKQILSWVSKAFEDIPFDCAPAAIDEKEDQQAVRRFQAAYNENKDVLGAKAADLSVDGEVGELTWGAFFDCYELALQRELDEDAAGIAELRAQLVFVDPERRFLGFGELFPIEELGVDEFRSLTNRRVEILFFEPGEEPDVARSVDDPETSELYLPGFYQRRALDSLGSARLGDRAIGVRVPMRFSTNKNFPKPGALPALRSARQLMRDRPELRLVIVGHADPTGNDADNLAVSLARAEAVRAWLMGDQAFFAEQFQKKDPVRKWEWEEIQWMLHGLKAGESPCYVGQADAFPGDRTEEALGSFQLTTEDLAASYAADEPTMDRLIQEYVGLLGDEPLEASRIEVVGGGSWHPPEKFRGGEALLSAIDARDLRRVELFLFAMPPRPPVAKFPKARAKPTVYRAWCNQVGQEMPAPRGPFHVEASDPAGLPLANTTLQLAQIVNDEDLTPIGSTTTDGRGMAALTIAPGLYVAQVQLGDGKALVATLLLDPDSSCGAMLTFRASAGLEPLVTE